MRRKKNEMAASDLSSVERYADSQLDPADVEFTKHFFDRVGDPRNIKPISAAELIGFFKRLAKKKKAFIEFLKQYNQFVVTDKRTDINIPFVKQVNQIIAKTIMRKKGFMTSNPKFTVETIKKVDGKYVVYPKKGGKRLGTHDTLSAAKKQLAAIEISKHEGINEEIKIPVEVGDTILTGRFKNKKVVVKQIGKDEHGMPTINGKKIVTFRTTTQTK